MTFFVLGDEDVVLGFQFVGIQGIIADTPEESFAEFDKITSGSYGEVGVLLISEKIGSILGEKIMSWQLAGKYPLIVEVPGMEGHLEGKKSMLDSIRKAIGLSV
jgi:V/A-type H+-transporting ATPase subunit F